MVRNKVEGGPRRVTVVTESAVGTKNKNQKTNKKGGRGTVWKGAVSGERTVWGEERLTWGMV